MHEHEAVRALAAHSELSLAKLSRAAGRCDNFLASSLGRGSSLTLATAVDIAQAAGFSLAFVPRGALPSGAIVIDPPRPLEAAGE